MKWPDGFWWGTGASSTQCEGAAEHSDWWQWERDGHAPLSGSGNDFTTRYAEDFAILADLGLTHHRLSVEWARIEPAEGEHDANAIAHYRDILHAAIDAGISPWVCLHHFTLPAWFSRRGGFLTPEGRTKYWTRHVEFVADTFGDLVAGWQPVNETNYYARGAYGGRGWPPGHNDRDEVAEVETAIQLATAEAAVRLKQTGAPVTSIFGLSPIIRHDEHDTTSSYAQMLADTFWTPGLGLFSEGVLRVRGRDPLDRPDLAGSFDLIGFSYYAAMGVANGEVASHPPGATLSPLGYGLWADGVGLVLDTLAKLVPTTPLLVAEFGIGTDDDKVRAAYLARGLDVVHEAIAKGIDVRGFFHWTAVDNYEWLHGYDVSFGIIDADRRVRPSADVLRREARG